MDGFDVATELTGWLGGKDRVKALELITRRRELAITSGHDWVASIARMHGKFGVNEVVDYMTAELLKKFLTFRTNFLNEELAELQEAKTAEDVVDALIDLCVVAIGTLDAFRIDSRQAWAKVYEKNMSKEPGVNDSRPNPFGLPDLVKPEGWQPPSHEGNHGLLTKVFAQEK